MLFSLPSFLTNQACTRITFRGSSSTLIPHSSDMFSLVVLLGRLSVYDVDLLMSIASRLVEFLTMEGRKDKSVFFALACISTIVTELSFFYLKWIRDLSAKRLSRTLMPRMEARFLSFPASTCARLLYLFKKLHMILQLFSSNQLKVSVHF